MFIDSHCHLDKLDVSHYANGLDELIDTTYKAGITEMLCIGVDTEQFPQMLKQISAYDFIHASAGIHPLGVKDASDFALLAQQAAMEKVIAVGETGLDYHYKPETKDAQLDSFLHHMQIADQVQKPLIVHSRSARLDTVELLRANANLEVGGVIHCFTEDQDMADKCLDLGFYISISGIATFRNAESLREVIKHLPLDRILIETDAPYLAPVPHRGKQNEPLFVPHVAQLIADLKGITLEHVANVTSENFYRLFNLKQSEK
jgi:TatD DNase family protein